MQTVCFTTHRQTRRVETPQLAYTVKDSEGRVKNSGFVNQSQCVELVDGDLLIIKALPVAKEDQL